MKQPEDNQTLELHLAEQRRGRGRPAKTDALTPAQRAKRYREAKRANQSPEGIKRDEKKVTENGWPDWGNEHERKAKALQVQLDLANDERSAAFKECDKLKKQVAQEHLVAEEFRKHAEILKQQLDLATKNIDQMAIESYNTNTARMIDQDWGNEQAERNIELQKKFDLEHLARIEAETKLVSLEEKAKAPKVNPLAAEVHKLKKALKDQDAQHAELMRAMRDENVQSASRKKLT